MHKYKLCIQLVWKIGHEIFQRVTYKLHRKEGCKIVLIPSLQVFKFSVVKHASHVFFHLLQYGEKSKIGQNRTKWCIFEKLTSENSPVSQGGVFNSCSTAVVGIPVSMTVQAQVVILSGSHIMLRFSWGRTHRSHYDSSEEDENSRRKTNRTACSKA